MMNGLPFFLKKSPEQQFHRRFLSLDLSGCSLVTRCKLEWEGDCAHRCSCAPLNCHVGCHCRSANLGDQRRCCQLSIAIRDRSSRAVLTQSPGALRVPVSFPAALTTVDSPRLSSYDMDGGSIVIPLPTRFCKEPSPPTPAFSLGI